MPESRSRNGSSGPEFPLFAICANCATRFGYSRAVTEGDDPERERIDALLGRVQSGEATEVERNELELHLESHPELRTQLESAEKKRELGRGWLARVEADRAGQALTRGSRVRAERGFAAVSMAIGAGLCLVSVPIGAGALLFGITLLLWSALRSNIQRNRRDPYRNIEQ